MLPSIKQYKLRPDTTKEDLLKAGFKEGGWQTQFKNPKVNYTEKLIDSINLHIEIEIDSVIHFDCFDNVLVLDDDYCQPYSPFYTYEPIKNRYLNLVVKRYNMVMDEFIKKGVFKYTIEEATKQYYYNEINVNELIEIIRESDEGDKERRKLEKEFYKIVKEK